jgi:ATP-binding protein involved in chromosome partitioning
MRSYHDITGDGGSAVLDQVAARRDRIRGNLAGVRWRVAVGSGKGGVGKSTLTYQLACALVELGRPVAVLDADFNGPTQARLGGLRDAALVPGERGGLALPRTPAGPGVVSLGSIVPEPESLEFDSVSKGDSHTWRATREFTLLGELLGSVEWGRLDLLLIDLPPGAERTFQYAEFLGPETAFLLVGVPSEVARGVVSRSVAALRRTPNRLLGYVENMKGYYCEDCGAVKPLFPETDGGAPDLPCLGSVPFDPRLARLCDRGERWPAGSDAPAARAVRDIAAKLIGALETPR